MLAKAQKLKHSIIVCCNEERKHICLFTPTTVLYASILAFAFVIIPFSYFYYEEFDEDVTIKQRIVGGLKYTIILLVIMVVSTYNHVITTSSSHIKNILISTRYYL